MGNLALRVDGLGKMYRIGGKQERYATLRDTLTDAMAAPFKRARSLLRGEAYGAAGLKEEIWALKDVSFEVKHGEVVGIIGRNGAGKSTLLKILSRITEPTEGYAEVYGRVGSLLEVGTGFHPELTGRENIYLNGAILGMSRAEIDRKFDEIVDFAEIERFIDTPVKHYSSGMGLRLGFAVAAHLEPEILVVDEVLAVGDAQFQKKCLGKMSEVAGAGRTVLFVSHNMAAVANLCEAAVILDQGYMKAYLPVSEAISQYMVSVTRDVAGDVDLRQHPNRRRGASPILQRVRLLDRNGAATHHFNSGDLMTIELTVSPDDVWETPHFGIGVDNSLGIRVFSLITQVLPTPLPSIDKTSKVTCQIEELPLAPGRYSLGLSAGISQENLLDAIDQAVTFHVESGDFFKSGRLTQAGHGDVLVHAKWKVQK
mgnify:CR=1 FL=1